MEEDKKEKYRFVFWTILATMTIFAIAGYGFLCALVLPVGMTGILIFQLKTGYSLNQYWEKDYSRVEKPLAYWSVIALNMIVCLFLYGFIYYIKS